MGDRIISYAGKLLVHAVRALLVCWQRMLRLGLSVGALSGLIALVVGAYVTRTVPPAPLTWVTALIFAAALGYAAAMTVLADEMLMSIFEAIGVLEGDIKAGMRAAAVAAEREAGEAGRGVMRLLGRPRKAPEKNAPAPERAAPSQPLVTLSSIEQDEPGQEQANETLAAIAATDAFITTAPRPTVNARPVRADQLPRIGWASDEASPLRAVGAVMAAAPTAPALAEMPPLPIRPLRSPSYAGSSASGALGENGAVAQQAGEAPTTQPAPYGAVTRPVSAPGTENGTFERMAADDDGVTQPAGTADTVAQSAIQGSAPTFLTSASDAAATGAERPATGTVPVNEETTWGDNRPPAVASQPSEPAKEERGIWARIGQALIGNTTVPLREANSAGTEDSSQTEVGQP